MTELTIDVGREPDTVVSQTFTLGSGLAMGASVKYGIYVPGDMTGGSRRRDRARGADCNGYRGSAQPTIGVAGDSVEVGMTLRPGNVCATGANDGGAGSGRRQRRLVGASRARPVRASRARAVRVLRARAVRGPAGRGAGSGARAGAGWAAATGGTVTPGCTGTVPAVGTPPRLTCCREYDHDDASCAGNAYIYGRAFSPTAGY